MEKNFQAVDLGIIKVGDVEIDLHSEFILSRISFSTEFGSLDLIWRPMGELAADRVVHFRFLGITRIATSYNNTGKSPYDSSTLNSIGYLPYAEFGRSDSFFMEKDFTDDSHVIFSFENESFLSVESDACNVQCYSEGVITPFGLTDSG